MKKAKRNRWVQRQINLERWTGRTILLVLFITSSLFSLVLIYTALSPYLNGVSMLDTKEKAERFSKSNYVDAVLPYKAAADTESSFHVASSQGSAVSVFLNGAYMEVPLPESRAEKEYRVWKLSCSGFTVLYCLEGEFAQTGRVHVQSQYRELSAQIIGELAPDSENIYVLYEAGPPLPFMLLLAGSIILAVIFFVLWRFPVFPERTHLGRQLAMMGGNKTAAQEMNRQALQPQFENANCTVLRDWILFRSTNAFMSSGPRYTEVIPISDVTGLDTAPDEDDSDLLACSFHVRHYNRPFTLYLDSKDVSQIQSSMSSHAPPQSHDSP